MDYLLPLKKRKVIAEKTLGLWFDIADIDFAFKAGQNVDLNSERTFTIASSPNDSKSIMIAWRTSDSAFKKRFSKVPIGTKVKVSKPIGSFVLHKNHERDTVFIAGGIGITPAFSMIKWATEEKLPHRMTLLYSNGSAKSAVFLSELRQLEKENREFTLLNSLGRLSVDFVNDAIKRLVDPIFYISGPEEMVASIREMLEDLGIDDFSIKSEEFTGY